MHQVLFFVTPWPPTGLGALAIPLTSPDRLGTGMEGLLVAIGIVLVLLVTGDLIGAVLSGGGRFGLYSGPLCRSLWTTLRAAAQRLPPRGRDAILDIAGPAMLVIVPACWVVLMILGFALLILPGLDNSFVGSGGTPIPADSRHWITSVYVSGYAFTTLGVGPFTPQSNGYRLLFLVEGAVGFATFTLAITYLLSVLSALRRRNAFARQVHHLTRGTNDALPLLEAIGSDNGLRREVLLELARGLHDVHESHLAYPVLHYFRHPEPQFAMSTLAGITADLVSLGRAVTPPDHAWHIRADAVVADGAAREVLRDLSDRFLPTQSSSTIEAGSPSDGPDPQRLERAARAVGEEAPPVQAEHAYARLRGEWLPRVQAFQRDMLFDSSPPNGD